MQEINELKNLVIQSLEGNGVLGQIRAQIRASIFKTIEMQETSTKKNAGFFWENPLCQTIYDNKEGKVALELINDFLDFFKMEYTMSVFSHESNLKDAARRDELLKKLGIKGDTNKPVLFQLINQAHQQEGSPSKENQLSGGPRDLGAGKPKPAGGANLGGGAAAGGKNISTDFQEADIGKKNFDSFGQKKAGFGGFGESQPGGAAGRLAPLSNVSPQDKFGSNKLQSSDLSSGDRKTGDKPAAGGELKKPSGGFGANDSGKFKSQNYGDEDDYENEVFENVDEELVDDLEEEEDPKNKDKKSMLTSSEDIIGASQSQGFDVSVDSLALEEYDYYENATKQR